MGTAASSMDTITPIEGTIYNVLVPITSKNEEAADQLMQVLKEIDGVKSAHIKPNLHDQGWKVVEPDDQKDTI